MHPFLSAVIGGALIGFSVVLLMFLSGRIAGISGIVGGLLPPKLADDWRWIGARKRMHIGSRHLWTREAVAALSSGDRDIHGCGGRNRVRHAACDLKRGGT